MFVINCGPHGTWNDIEKLTGYKPLTKHYEFLKNCESLGRKDLREGFNKIFQIEQTQYENTNDPRFITELAMVVNWLMWEANDNGIISLSVTYERYYHKVNDWCLNNLKGDNLTYYVRTTD